MIWPTRPLPVEPPLISTLSVGAYCTPSSARDPPPAMFSVLFLLASHAVGSMNGGLVGTTQFGSFLTRRVIGRGGVGEVGPLVSTSWLSQSRAAVAATPVVAEGGNFVPALSAIVS